MAPQKLFLLGPGYIGGEILDLLLKDGNYEITTMVRRKEAAEPFEKLGVNVLLATLDDRDVIIKQVLQSDTVIHTATADHLPSVESICEGIEQRAKAGKSTNYIHTSGASLLADDSAGNWESDKIFDDEKPEDIDALPESAPHRVIDLAIIRARERLGKSAKLALMIPPLIYGVSPVHQKLSIQLPTMARYSIKHGYAGQVGKGLSVWSQVHVADLVRGYVMLLHWLESNESDDIYRNPYFFCENGHDLSWGAAAVEIGKVLYEAGIFKSPEVKTIPEELYCDIFGQEFTHIVLGCNSKNRGNRIRKLGWKPQEKLTLESLREDELPMIMKEDKPFAGYSKAVAS